MQNILLCVYLVSCIMRKSYETGKFYEFAKQKTKKTTVYWKLLHWQSKSILETTTLTKYLACLPHQYQTKEKKLHLSIT